MREFRPEGSVYKIEKCVGQGRTATVYRAVREDLRGHSRQTVALKVLKNRTAVPWLRREFETLARVNSPYCVRVLSWENLETSCALVLEWIDGITLLDLARTQALSPEVIGEVVAQVQLGLLALREQGLHHGDLSPVNILVDRQGSVRIVDFATAAPEQGYIHGTAAYLSPEIWSGASSNFEADLFALGLIELDLRERFRSVPPDPPSCKMRAFQVARDCGGFLSMDPRKRTPAIGQTESSLRDELGALVSRCLDEATLPVLETATHPLTAVPNKKMKRPFHLRRAAAVALAVGVATGTGVSAQAPIRDREEAAASLVVTSQKWLRIELNGKDAGYAPFRLSKIRPGSHRIHWQTAAAQGEMRLHLEPGQVAHLKFSDRLRLDAARNR